MGRPELADDPRYATHAARGANQAELDDLINDWTRVRDIAEVEALLIANGVPAGKVYRAPEMLADPQYAARDSIVTVDHPVFGKIRMQNAFPKLSETPGEVRWLYDARGQASIGTVLATMQRLARQDDGDRVSVVMVKLRDGFAVDSAVTRLRTTSPDIDVRSVAELVGTFRQRLVYFKQLALILGTVSLIVTVLLIATLLTITVNERLGEIATLRAIGVQRTTILSDVLADGLVLTVIGGSIGLALGLATARYLDAILTGFPGLPAAFSFFVARPPSIALAGVVLLGTGAIAGLYPAWLAASTPIAATLRAEAT